ncbi:hypothetical protein ACFW1J_25615 [Priestia aryabhattai]|uniref:hypothetical protein n=1 Tax=Priestia aryabhattai TaxID=412384 RepID=UPI0008DD43E6|nr:hypothetical protein [Priestia aryabhattai]OHY73534.1 hypothetical protein BCV52_25760 [Priestia aryabhattai]
MNVLDAKVITTITGLEIYLELMETSQIRKVCIPTIDHPFYEIQFGIKYFLLRNEKYYDSHRSYFSICMNNDLTRITLQEPETESLFAVKSQNERQATQNLLGEWFIKTNAYKESIKAVIKEVKKENVYTEEDIQHTVETVRFLEKLLTLTSSDIQKAPLEKMSNSLQMTTTS